jgi:hypothetical protein
VATNTVTAGGIMTGVGSTTLPAQGLVPTTANRLELVEIAIENTTAVSCIWRLVRWTGGAGTCSTPAPDRSAPSTGPGLSCNYEPGNLRWASRFEQGQNRRQHYRKRLPRVPAPD